MEQLLKYIINEPPEDAESTRIFKYVTDSVLITLFKKKLFIYCVTFRKFPCLTVQILFLSRFPFIACEIFTCEIDVILKTLVEEEEVEIYYRLYVMFNKYLEFDFL